MKGGRTFVSDRHSRSVDVEADRLKAYGISIIRFGVVREQVVGESKQ